MPNKVLGWIDREILTYRLLRNLLKRVLRSNQEMS